MATKKAVAPVVTPEPVLESSTTEPVLASVHTIHTEDVALVSDEVLNELIAEAPKQEVPNADELFNAAMSSQDERIAHELDVESMTQEQLQEEFGWSLSEAVGIMREAVVNSKTLHADQINLMIDKIEAISAL